MQKKVLPSHKLQDHAYEQQQPFRLKEDNPHWETARVNWLIQVCLTQSKDVNSIWFKEKLTFNQTWKKTSNICKANF